jgi:hypothetical protein
MTTEARCALVAHPAAPPRAALALTARVAVRGPVLRLELEMGGDVAAVAIPEPVRDAARADRLWEHTCFEAFLASSEGDAYLEVNLSPSGEWALWAFDGYRAGMRAAPLAGALRVDVSRGVDALRISAALPVAQVVALLGAPVVVVGPTAVVEERGGGVSYWACRHAGERPDFHRRDGWTVAVYASAVP